MSPQNENTISPDIRRLLARLRWRIRLYVWIAGGCACLALAGTLFWVGMGLDWLFEPPVALRVIAGLGVAVVLAVAVQRWILGRVFAHLSDRSMALVAERYFDAFKDGLLTSVEYANARDGGSAASQAMLQHTSGDAAALAREVDLSRVFNPLPLIRNAVLASMALLSIAIFALLARESFAVYLERLALSDRLWPRSVRLVVEGFAEDSEGFRREKVARGGGLRMTIRADNRPPFRQPSKVEIRYRASGGSRVRGDATRQGLALAGESDYQDYQFAFKDVHEDITFQVIGDDDRVRSLHLQVVERPQVVACQLECRYPKYMRRSDVELPATGAMQIPAGTQLRLRATTNKPLRQVTLREVEADQTQVLGVADLVDSATAFEFPLGDILADRDLSIDLVDTDGVRTETPFRVRLAAVADESPQVTAALRGIGEAVTPQARVPFLGEARDDYGLATLEFLHQVDDQQPATTALSLRSEQLQEQSLDTGLELEPLELTPGSTLRVAIQASDSYDLGDEPGRGVSRQFTLKVVTPERLQTILHGIELTQRRRFQTIYGETTRARNRLARLELPQQGESNDPLQRENRRLLTGLGQDVQRARHELLVVATAFEDVRDQLENNRIQNPKLKSRVIERIAVPVRKISDGSVKRLEQLLDEFLEETVAGRARAPLRQQSVAQADKVLVEMKAVLDDMEELEEFNELIAKLRSLITDQDRLIELTRQRQRADLRGSLLD